ncbi:MAG: bifunctional serine/threonine-protein kinase/formylglycine-generating enzyme family protein [Verrucomicrobiales bacterium]
MQGPSDSPDFPDHETYRDMPQIPDYELIRCVGKGSYGEVWLGRSVTGSLRAVKIVRRETFEMERTFRREVEGIENFEPISRGHPGLVDILHVGWRETEGFFYYVMELADDRLHAQKIQISDYEPRTLASARTPGEKLPLDQCIDVGISLADALGYLHDRNLIHRDIKPSNVVFVDGEAKLVDIGLVAPTGQKTFVGTEGFVPPEGPGSASADLYSLGMVLYEISTGNDRLEFPELPASGFARHELSKWHRLNAIICKACAPNPSKRYISARGMTEDLRDLRAGRKAKPSLKKRLLQTALVMLVLVAAGLGFANHQGMLPTIKWRQWLSPDKPTIASNKPPAAKATDENSSEKTTAPDGKPEIEPIAVARSGQVQIDSLPPDAEIFLNGTQKIGTTGRPLMDVPAGKQSFEIRLAGYDSMTIEGTVDAKKPLTKSVELQLTKGPRPGEPWVNSLNMEFSIADGQLLSEKPMSADLDSAPSEIRNIPWNGKVELLSFITDGELEIESFPALSIPEETAIALCDALTNYERANGFIPADRLYEPAPGPRAPGYIEREKGDNSYFHLRLTTYASLKVETAPEGAEVWLNGELQATPTPVTVAGLKSGTYEILLKKDGYEDLSVTGIAVTAGKQESRSLALVASRKLAFGNGKVWDNSLNMRFIPLGDIMLSRFETRREDYDLFAESTGRGTDHIPKFPQELNHPVVGVNREDAEAFCRWLTAREQAEGLLPEDVAYRLPTDLEWSLAAGLGVERGSSPKERNQQMTGKFPWGFEWPPPQAAGNFADSDPGHLAARGELLNDGDDVGTGAIVDYVDDYAFTAPVGSFPADKRGNGEQFFDLAGNVFEWIADDFDPTSTLGTTLREGVLRGGSWNTSAKEFLWTSTRHTLPPDFTYRELAWENGFRCALAKTPKVE